MSTIRGTSQETWESNADTLSCLIPCPPDTPVSQFPFWKTTSSKDGTRLAVPMQISPEECHLYTWTLGETSPEVSDPVISITDIQPNDNQSFSILCQSDEGWTVIAGDQPWDLQAEFAWNLCVSKHGVTAMETQEDRQYTPVVNGIPWNRSYENTFGLTLADDAERSAAAVQTVPLTEGDLDTFRSGCFSLATETGPWPGNFMGVFTPAISKNGALSAVDVRLTQYDYTVVVNGRPWSSAWSSVWAPIIHPEGASVCAPVKEPEGWTLVRDGEPFWPGHHAQLWEPAFSPNGRRVAAVVAPHFGTWTLALDGILWKSRVDGYLTRPVFSPCGSRVGATGVNKGKAILLIDDCIISGDFDKAWDPIFSKYGKHVAARIKKGPLFSFLLDGATVNRPFLWMEDPVFTPDGKHMMICGIERQGPQFIYTREFIALK